jgi:hypothetical protein
MTHKINGLFLGELVPDTTVGGCIEIFENVWPDPADAISSVEQLVTTPNSGVYWQRASTIGAGPFQQMRTNKLMSITHLAEVADSGVLQNINNQFYTLLLSAGNSYAKRFGIHETFWHEGYQLLKYGVGEEYKAHYDSTTNTGRIISALCYLNSDFEGGELEFINFGIKIKPQPGMLILFPSNYAYTHVAHPVTSGTKYSLVTWIRDRDDGDRT